MLQSIVGRKKTVVGLICVLLLAFAGILWSQRGAVLSWYYLRSLAKATDSNRTAWVDRVVSLEGAVVPGLLKGMEVNDAQSCANFSDALEGLTKRWGVDDPRTNDLMQRIADDFSRFSSAGQQKALALIGKWQLEIPSHSKSAESLDSAVEKIIGSAAYAEDSDVRAAALDLSDNLIARSSAPQGAIQELLKAALHDAAFPNRIKAVQLACEPRMNLFKEVVALLNDKAAEVRRQAMDAVRRQPRSADVLGDDDLLRWLNDPDEQVRRLCEMALAERGLTVEAIQLGRLITNSKPSVRLEVLQYLNPGSDLDANTWIRHLSHDKSPAVRSAAIRAAVQLDLRNLSDRLDQMARADPSATIRQLAQHYLSVQQGRPPAKPRQ
jgi:hypothetical protein